MPEGDFGQRTENLDNGAVAGRERYDLISALA
jgi:hypothetical protein